MMYKFELGQEVIFIDMFCQGAYKYGVIHYRGVDEHGRKKYTIKRGLHFHGNVLEENIQEYTKMLEPQKVKSWDFAMDIFKEAKDMKPVDTTTKFQDGYVDALGYVIKHYWINESVIGLPHEVHFKEEKNRTTLVWKRGDNYSSTTSEAHEEKFDRLYGFLMAYFKKVHEYRSKTWRKKYLDKNVYPLKAKEQKHFLTTIFAQNCGLETEEVYKYLNEIVKDKEGK